MPKRTNSALWKAVLVTRVNSQVCQFLKDLDESNPAEYAVGEALRDLHDKMMKWLAAELDAKAPAMKSLKLALDECSAKQKRAVTR